LFFNTFFEGIRDYKDFMSGELFPELAIDPKRYMEDYFGINLTIKTGQHPQAKDL